MEAPPDPAESRNALWDAIGSQLTLADYGESRPVVGGKWEIEGILGRGGFGLVCVARDPSLPRRIAIKLLPQGPEMVSLMREARSLAQLDHPAIVTIFDVAEGQVVCGDQVVPCGWIAMQLVDGDTLDGWLKKTRPKASAVISIIVAVGRALAHAHAQGILHRDLKPPNIMIDAKGRPFLIDFGLALAPTAGDSPADGRAVDGLGTRATVAGAVRGTPSYMAPEATAGQPSPKSDQFSLAVVAWEVLTGAHPWSSDPTAPVRSGVLTLTSWKRIEPVLQRGMASRPRDRFESIEAFCDQLKAAGTSRLWRNRTVALASAALALGGVILWLAGPRTLEPPKSEALVRPQLAESSCQALETWEGRWSLTGRVIWTEYSNQLGQSRPVDLSIERTEGCTLAIEMQKFLPAYARESDEFLSGEAEVIATPGIDGSWSVAYDLEFPGDRRTYGKAEHHRFALVLDRSPVGEPRVTGSYAKVQTDGGLVLRNGLILGRRDRRPTLAEVEGHEPSCDARCRVHCAGAAATQACLERQCAPYQAPLTDPCGPPSSDFVAPLRARVERSQLLAGKRFGAKNAAADRCENNAARVAGLWWLWRATEDAPELSRMEVSSDGCLLHATLRRAGSEHEIAMSGEITGMGIWYLARDGYPPNDPRDVVLAGTGPALGLDMAGPGHLLRAFRP